MYDCFISILLLILIYYVYHIYYDKSDILQLCKKTSDKKSTDVVEKPNEKKSTDTDEKPKSCQDQLFDVNKKYNELKLNVEDPYNYVDYYDSSNSDRYLISTGNIHGDDVLTTAMLNMGKKSQQSIINRAMFDKSSLLPYFEEELELHANNQAWWDDDDLEDEF